MCVQLTKAIVRPTRSIISYLPFSVQVMETESKVVFL